MSILTFTLAIFHHTCYNFSQTIWVHLAHLFMTVHFKFIGAIVEKVVIGNGGLIKIDCAVWLVLSWKIIINK